MMRDPFTLHNGFELYFRGRFCGNLVRKRALVICALLNSAHGMGTR